MRLPTLLPTDEPLITCARQHSYTVLGASRQGFNVPHTKATEYWLLWLIGIGAELGECNLKEVLLAAIFHDVGWAFIPEEQIENQKLMTKMKNLHAFLGARESLSFLRKFVGTRLSASGLERIFFLVLNHDRVDIIPRLGDPPLSVLAMADTLGQIDTGRVIPTLKAEEVEAFLLRLHERRRPLFSGNSLAEMQLGLLLEGFRAYFGL